jgi:hypothetical protein
VDGRTFAKVGLDMIRSCSVWSMSRRNQRPRSSKLQTTPGMNDNRKWVGLYAEPYGAKGLEIKVESGRKLTVRSDTVQVRWRTRERGIGHDVAWPFEEKWKTSWWSKRGLSSDDAVGLKLATLG